MTAPAAPMQPAPTSPRRNPRHWLIGGAVFLAVAVIAALVIALDTATAPADTTSYVRTATPSDEQAFLLSVRTAGIPVSGAADEVEWVGLGHDVCRALHDGATYQQVVEAGATEFGPQQRQGVVGSAVLYLCPQHKAALPRG